jgi:hypothetical protein
VPLVSSILGTMELEQNHTKHWLDWIGNTTTVFMLLPVALIGVIIVGLYFVCKFPIWWLYGKWRGYKRKSINRDNKNFL